jgi:hypothetical protein
MEIKAGRRGVEARRNADACSERGGSGENRLRVAVDVEDQISKTSQQEIQTHKSSTGFRHTPRTLESLISRLSPSIRKSSITLSAVPNCRHLA